MNADKHTDRENGHPHCPPRPEGQRVALVLQGGGALGAYQAGVYEALDEHGFCPDWIAGTSIGAINGALIAGNPPANRVNALRDFWDSLSQGFDPGWVDRLPDQGRSLLGLGTAMLVACGGVPNFFRPRTDWVSPWLTGQKAETASFYDTGPLRELLGELVDFGKLNEDGVRLSVGAVNVRSGKLSYFDSHQQSLDVRHIAASGALPPGFPAVNIDGELYWDGAVYSNTPLEVVLEDKPRVDTLCFAVSLFPTQGAAPQTVMDVEPRHKDITYGSRLDRHVDAYQRLHNLRRKINAIYERLPDELQNDPDIQALAQWGCHTTMQIVKLAYPCRPWELSTKDIDFSRATLNERWQLGYEAALSMLEQAPWLQQPHSAGEGVIIHTPSDSTEAIHQEDKAT